MKKIIFNKDFMFGACTSAEQSEGYHTNYKTNWDIFYNKKSDEFYNNVGPKLASQTYKMYEQDAKLYGEIGFNSFRTSFSWARLFPKRNVIDKQAIEFYRNYIKAIKINKMKIIICLSHFDLPDWVVELGGIENAELAIDFAQYAKLVLDEFGSEIDYIVTFNEPIVNVVAGYLGNDHWPCVVDSQRSIKAAYGMIYWHSKVVDLFNQQYRNKLSTKIGVIVNLTPTMPKDNITFTKQDQVAADIYNLLHNYALLDAMCKGIFSEELIDILKKENLFFLPPQHQLDVIKRNKLDFIGINYYCPFRVEACAANDKADSNNFLSKYIKPYSWPKARMNPFRGWEIRPETLFDICELVKNRYMNIPFYISENGMGVQGEEKFRNENGFIDDYYRIAFIQEHLDILHQAIEKYDVNCFGYHLWASIDCWSWKNAYKNRYGLIEVDINTGRRIPKRSSIWYHELCEKKSFSSDYKKIENFIDINHK